MVLQSFQSEAEKWDFRINKTTNELSLTKTLDGLKRLTPNLHDSLTLSRHRNCLSIQRSKSVRSVIKSLLRKKKQKPRLSPMSQWCKINPSPSTSEPLTRVDLHFLCKQ